MLNSSPLCASWAYLRLGSLASTRPESVDAWGGGVQTSAPCGLSLSVALPLAWQQAKLEPLAQILVTTRRCDLSNIGLWPHDPL
jgi:hypothetical protein